jgi:hypothetical protein
MDRRRYSRDDMQLESYPGLAYAHAESNEFASVGSDRTRERHSANFNATTSRGIVRRTERSTSSGDNA